MKCTYTYCFHDNKPSRGLKCTKVRATLDYNVGRGGILSEMLSVKQLLQSGRFMYFVYFPHSKYIFV